jgi:uncharacterized protein YdeI (YjbR/CyaY-like superfamily)
VQDFPDIDAYIDASDQWPDEIAALRPLLLASALDERIKWELPATPWGMRTLSSFKNSPTTSP